MKLSRLTDNVNTLSVEFGSMEELAQIITLANWAPGVFRNNYRNLSNFESTDLLALDIDEGCTIEEAQKLFSGYQHVIATTRNHQKEKNGVVCDRYRVILRLEYPITTPRTYTSTYLSFGVHFPFIDLACGDAARQFFKSLSVVSIQSTGKTIQPVERGAVAKTTIEFLASGAEKGKWNLTLFKAAKDLQQQGYDKDETIELLKRPTGSLDNKDLSTIESAFNKEPRHPARIEDESPLAADSWVGEWIIKKALNINYNEQIVLDGVPLNFGQIEDRLLLDTAKMGHKFSDKLLFASLRIYYDNALLSIIEEIRKKLSFNDSIKQNHVADFVKALEGKENPLTEAVIRHFIWSVKRKMNKRKVIHHMMPILVGKTGGGKTEAVKRFIEPLFTLTTFKQLNIVNDERQLFNFSKYFIVFFDEMSRADKADVDCLKNIISSDVVAYRMMGKNKNSVGNNVSTFIGAANNDVKNLINDPTSVRRYYQLNCQDVIDREVINNIPYLALWQSVNENGPAPIVPFLEQLAPIQEASRSQSLIEEWLELECIINGENWTKGTDALREFNDWIKTNNLKGSYRPQRFMEELGKIVEKKRIDNQRMYRLQIKASFNPTN